MDFLGHKLIPNSLRTPIHPREPIEQPLLLNIGLKKSGRRKIFGKEVLEKKEEKFMTKGL